MWLLAGNGVCVHCRVYEKVYALFLVFVMVSNILQELKEGKLSDIDTSHDGNRMNIGSGWNDSDPESGMDEEVALLPSTMSHLGKSQL